MSAQTRFVDVTDHARMRWLQRVSPSDPFPAESVREAFEEGVTTAVGERIRRVHRRLGVVLVGVRDHNRVSILTVYSSGAGGQQ